MEKQTQQQSLPTEQEIDALIGPVKEPKPPDYLHYYYEPDTVRFCGRPRSFKGKGSENLPVCPECARVWALIQRGFRK